ncbi:MAG: diaminopimelate epimerase [Bacteroidia bacterium]|nr:diaminopimelate epimerase [Bacteroidia bacterium]MDW8235297.1 diaminopimelate epimerase [Bacteroidia bacterium]
MRFRKLHATGNDFILLEDSPFALTTEQRRRLCDRHIGIGADGILFIEKGEGIGIYMHYWNADGALGSFCGNGARASMWSAYQRWNLEYAVLHAADGVHAAQVLQTTPPLVSVQLHLHAQPKEIGLHQWFVHTGSPHKLIEVPLEELNKLRLEEVAPPLRYDTRWDEGGVNVSFFARDETGWHIRTYERGVESETLSCGTACAALAVLANESELTIYTRGGLLRIRKEGAHIWLIGEVEEVFWGEWKTPL